MNEQTQIKNLRLSQKNTLIRTGSIFGIVLCSIIFVVMILMIVVLALACTLLSQATGKVSDLNDIIDLGQIGKTINGGIDGVSDTVKKILDLGIAFIVIETVGLVLSILMISINRMHPVIELIFSILIFIANPVAGIILLIGVIISFVQRHKIIKEANLKQN